MIAGTPFVQTAGAFEEVTEPVRLNGIVFLVLSSAEKGFHGHAHILPVVSTPLQCFTGYEQLKQVETRLHQDVMIFPSFSP